ncbi:MAG: ATP synthase F0 subunit B [Chloroflexi bacterium]|nr:ATP synthase F0 subunit B [Chloroflexota bacterium]
MDLVNNILAALGVTYSSLIWHAINFLILLFILNRFAFPKVLAVLDERAHRIRESFTHAEALRAETERLHEEGRQTLAKSWQDAQAVLADAQRSAESVLADARLAAREEGDLLIQRARAEIEAERDRAFQELRRQVADLVVAAATHVVARSLDDAGHRELVEQFLATEADGSGNGSASVSA